MAEHAVRIMLHTGMTWSDIVHEVNEANVPSDARVSTHHDPGSRDPREYAYTELIFTWGNKQGTRGQSGAKSQIERGVVL